jgi:hypothetical protein
MLCFQINNLKGMNVDVPVVIPFKKVLLNHTQSCLYGVKEGQCK